MRSRFKAIQIVIIAPEIDDPVSSGPCCYVNPMDRDRIGQTNIELIAGAGEPLAAAELSRDLLTRLAGCVTQYPLHQLANILYAHATR